MPLVALADIKAGLRITGSADDALITSLEVRAQALIEDYLGYPLELSAARSFQRRFDVPARSFQVPFGKVRSISRLVIGGQVILDTTEGIVAGEGFAVRESGLIYPPDCVAFCGEVDVTFESGYRLADDGADLRDLPAGIEHAAIETVGGLLARAGRDPNVTAEAVPGVSSVQYERALIAQGLPPTAVEALQRFMIRGIL